MRRAAFLLLLVACGDDVRLGPCEPGGAAPSLAAIDCPAEWDHLAARPLDASLPGAFTVKTIIDRADGDAVHFLDTEAYPLHQRFAVDHLGWPPGQPFFQEYLTPQRRFLLGSITRFERPGQPDLWTYELAPYDTADAALIARSLELLGGAAYFGGELAFHPTSLEQEARAAELPAWVTVVTTEEIYRGATYQPLNLGETVAQVRLVEADRLEQDYVSPREIAVLDRVPNDIAVVAAVVTEEFQTPLSHVNVLSQQRGTPNMALRDARARLAPYEGRWVRLTVGPFDWEVTEVTLAEADAWWQANRPDPVAVVPPDPGPRGFLDVDRLGLADVAAVGGKAAQFGELRAIRGVPELVVRDGFAIPVHHYLAFLEETGLAADIEAMLVDEEFRADAGVRRARLEALQAAIESAPLDPDFLAGLEWRIRDEFGRGRMRFRSSSTAEDLARFSGAGLHASASGAVGDPEDPVADAVRKVWASLWRFRAFEEREYAGIDHRQVAMGILVHPAYVDETAQGVAITANLFDPGPTGEDAFYINAQVGDVSVVQPPGSGVVAEQLLYFHFHAGQPATYFTRSSLVPPGDTVLTRRQLFELGRALAAVREHFADLYDPPPGFARLPLDVEFERVGSVIEVKQVRPHPGRGGAP